MQKIWLAVGCSALLMSGLLPIALAHNDTNSGVGTAVRTSGSSDGVSGVYITNPAAFLVASSLFPIVIDEETSLFPNGFAALGGGGLCDAEILSSGNGPSDDLAALDETQVDGVTVTGGSVPDGTFDDGGFGAVCHTPYWHYNYADYNTAGCGGSAYAEDAVSGGDIWIGAFCSTSVSGGAPPEDVCVVNAILSWGGDPAELTSCITDTVNCELDPECGSAGGVSTCGGDDEASITEVTFGRGGDGVAYPGISNGCTTPDARAGVFVLETVITDSTTVAATTAGVVDTTPL